MSGINVVVPLGGLGSRFQKEGYLTRPKPFVPVLGKPMILWVLENLTIGADDTLVIVYNPAFMNIGVFMNDIVQGSFPDCKLVELPGPTRGAAETVLFGLRGLSPEQRERPTVLVDGDTFYTVDVVGKYREVASTHNAVFCFHDTQPNPIYSYIKMDDADEILEIKEKIKISDWANSGCYCFKSGAALEQECVDLIEANSKQLSQDGVGEFYTSGVIATMISKKEPFKGLKIDAGDMHVLGTPAQVEHFCRTWPSQPRQRFVFDLEGVLLTGNRGPPIQRNVELAKRLKAQGHVIIVLSTRPWGMERQTWSLLESHGIPCDDLQLGKPRGEFYISGSQGVDSLLADIDKQIGFHETDIKATASRGSRHSAPPKAKKAKMQKIGSLHPSTAGFNCLMRVLDEPREISKTTRGSTQLSYWEVPAGDDTGKVTLSLRADQCNKISKDQLVIIRNGHVKIIDNHIRLVVDKWGKVDVDVGDATLDALGTHDVSSVTYELVET
mmetsp:Transcript_15463/g.33504  ORF Transcript_15463/g.33504 Transcript_15463/m.33504 type:complete len:498 (-) Transcript_15463:47-1540(-)